MLNRYVILKLDSLSTTKECEDYIPLGHCAPDS